MSKNIITTPKKQKRIYVPYMCDHSRILAAALRACGVEAEVLPFPDQESIELGRRYSSGKECLPMAITLGDFIKKIRGGDFSPGDSTFFMPSADGPCRFGQYASLQRLIFEELGHEDVEILSLNTIDSYGFANNKSDSKTFKKLAWKGIVAVDMMEKALWYARPYELNVGDTDKVYEESLKRIDETISAGNDHLEPILKGILANFKGIPVDRSKKRPVIGVIGEIFVRANKLSNQDIVRRIEEFGGEGYISPMSEWFMYTTYLFWKTALHDRKYLDFIKGKIEDLYQRRVEHNMASIFEGFVRAAHEPSMEEIMANCALYLNCSAHSGEAVLGIGKAVDMIRNNKVSGIINILPFSCMPGLIVTAISKKIKEDHRAFPWLNIDYDGTAGGNLWTRLEAFLYQVKESV